MTYTILIPLLITAACFIHFHRRLGSNAGWFSRIIAGLVTLGVSLSISFLPWVLWILVDWRFA